MQLNISGIGNEAPAGGVPGDLLVVIEEEQHKDLKRDGATLHYETYVNLADAALGASTEVPLVSGKAKVKIEPGTQSGTTMRLRGKGLPSVNHHGTGDLLRTRDGVDPYGPEQGRKGGVGETPQQPRFPTTPHGEGQRLLRARERDVRELTIPTNK